jgi:hypothetical protein
MKNLQELYNSPDRWTKDALARKMDGTRVPIDHPEAYSFYLFGGLIFTYGEHTPEFKEKIDILRNYTLNVFNEGVITYNNDVDTSFEDIQRLVKELGL